jgi:CheY-like chemotaxis protein
MEDLRLSYFKQVKDKNIDIMIDVDVNKNVIVNSDKYRLRQILMNLIGNAIKFTNDGYVRFGYHVLNSHQLEIYVEDTGHGIERQYQRVIFERFKQLNPNNKFKGAGLGLSITKSLVELLGFGDIKIISELEKGSKFYFIVPYTVKHYNYINEIKERNKNKKLNFTGKNILIVEDDTDSTVIMKSYLHETHATIFTLNDGAKVIDFIKNNDIDIIILDIGLPNKSGYEILKEIREMDDRLPVIIESALAMPDKKSKAYQLGCDDFISKPFNKEEFLNKIDNLI